MSEEADAFWQGWRHGWDPANSGADGPATTTNNSFWLADWCQVCGHTFREADGVYVAHGPPAVVRHHSPTLPCSGLVTDYDQPDDGMSRAFHAAVEAANPPPPGTDAVLLLPGHPLLLPVTPRRQCAFCSDSFRPFESAVICPCSPGEPRCGLGVHRDPGGGNTCYDEWISNGPLLTCPTTFTKVEER
ncbi:MULTISPECIES: hypothetical protein [Nonomuraea]|uniref:Uncharacterized protein n=1 Tax=Nonomuraea mangrovi TaxID=2316207 RepID=A0ABW4SN07_9ACTN